MADQTGNVAQLSKFNLAARPKLVSLPTANRNIDSDQIHHRFKAAIEAEAGEIVGTVPRVGIAMESSNLSLPSVQPPTESPRPVSGITFMKHWHVGMCEFRSTVQLVRRRAIICSWS